MDTVEGIIEEDKMLGMYLYFFHTPYNLLFFSSDNLSCRCASLY